MKGLKDEKMKGLKDEKMTCWHDDTMTWWHDDMIKGSYVSNPKLCPLTHSLTHFLTRVRSRDASASKNLSNLDWSTERFQCVWGF